MHAVFRVVPAIRTTRLQELFNGVMNGWEFRSLARTKASEAKEEKGDQAGLTMYEDGEERVGSAQSGVQLSPEDIQKANTSNVG